VESARKGDIKETYNITGKLSKRKYQGMQPTTNKDGALLTNERKKIFYSDSKSNRNRTHNFMTIIITKR
jgi:hypothetical protein